MKPDFAANPSRSFDDNSYAARIYESKAAIEAANRDNEEAKVLREICTIFSIPFSKVIKAAGLFGEPKLSFKGFSEVVNPPFPCRLTLALQEKGKGDSLSFLRFVKNPKKLNLIEKLLNRQSLDTGNSSRMLVGYYPRLGDFLAVVFDLKITSDVGIITTTVLDDAGNPVTCHIAALKVMLQAMRNQELWTPQIEYI